MVVFVVTQLLGDPARLILPLDATEEHYLEFRARLGLDRPVPERLAEYMLNLARGDFGRSLWQDVPAMEIVLERVPATLYLAGMVVAVSMLIAVPLGILGATRPGSKLDRLVVTLSFAGVSTPSAWLALMLIWVFPIQLGVLKTSGFGGPEHLVLPLATLCAYHVGRISQVVRASVLDELNKQYVTTGRSKGLTEPVLLYVHVLRNAALPIVTLAGDEVAGLINGSVVVEVIFAWPGVGRLALESILRRDLPVVQSVVLFVASSVVVINLLVDLAYARLDPRIRYR